MYHKDEMKLLLGVQIEEPQIFMYWNTNEDDFTRLFQAHGFRKIVEKGYFVQDINFLGQQHCNMGVEFRKTIHKISFSRASYDGYEDFSRSFKSFQIALEKAYGKPNERAKGSGCFGESYEWNICNQVKIRHYLMDRFGWAEHLYIERI